MTELFDWFRGHDTLLWWLFAGSVALFIGTLIALPIIVGRIPADYFEPTAQEWRLEQRNYSPWRIVLIVLKNILGLVLLVAGIAMLVLPGQGIITILVGIMLLNFPGKYALERWVVTRPRVLRGLNWIRRKRGAPPLEFDEPANPDQPNA